MFWKIVGLVTAVKLLWLPAYHSTDFEVHRNWLAITYSKPVKAWYYESTSQWTLDYPPLFAWFEFCLSHIAKYVDPQMLVINNLNYDSHATVLFQRLSVVFTDLVLASAVKQYAANCLPKKVQSSTSVLAILMLGNAGLLLVDHLHFQYNGFLYGMLLMSFNSMIQGHIFSAAFWFTVLLNFKHIYLYMAPAYGIYLLRNYVFSNDKGGWRGVCRSFFNLVGLGLVVLSVFAVSFGPFIAMKQIQQVLSRLFPFKRGLCHAYWAPNFWALYNGLDKALTITGLRAGVLSKATLSQASMTGGLVQEYHHTVLPSIPPVVTLACCVAAMLPCLWATWRGGRGVAGFLRPVILCAWASFMFGWHVHEKAILMVILPLTLLAVENKRDARVFLVLATTGHLSLLPLIFTPAETLIKYCLFLLYSVTSFVVLGKLHGDTGSRCRLPLLSVVETVYVLGLVAVELACQVVHPALGLQHTLAFLPLMVTSLYTAVGVSYTWLVFYWNFMNFTAHPGGTHLKLN